MKIIYSLGLIVVLQLIVANHVFSQSCTSAPQTCFRVINNTSCCYYVALVLCAATGNYDDCTNTLTCSTPWSPNPYNAPANAVSVYTWTGTPSGYVVIGVKVARMDCGSPYTIYSPTLSLGPLFTTCSGTVNACNGSTPTVTYISHSGISIN